MCAKKIKEKIVIKNALKKLNFLYDILKLVIK